jgi:DNA-binding HxlR family transcriptional regulator
MNVSDQAHEATQSNDCPETPLGRAIRLLGDAWILLIIMNLLQGSMRFNTLRAALKHISAKTLSSRLKLLEELGFVQRRAFLEIPPRVEYHITEKGQELGEVIGALEKFGNKHLAGQPETMGNDCSRSAEETLHCQDASST